MGKKPLFFSDDGFGGYESRGSRSIVDAAGKDTVVVAMFKRLNGTVFFRVSVHSQVKQGLAQHYEIEYDNKSSRQLQKEFAVAGGALAESLDEAYGDTLNPDVCAKLAWDAYTEMMADISRQSN